MKIIFEKCMMQRYRAILHYIDPIIDRGHDLTICVSCDKNVPDVFERPCDVAWSSENSVRYLDICFGTKVKNFKHVKFEHYDNNKGVSVGIDKCGTDFSIPYISYYSGYKGAEKMVGNTMCQAIRDRMYVVDEIKNSVLIMHPGGGRGYISPIRSDIDADIVDKNNIDLINNVLFNLPESIEHVTIKTHPVPYLCCDKEYMEKYIVPKLCRQVKIENSNMIDLVSSHEYIINFGSSTVVWLIGSPKKWINIMGLLKYNVSYEHHRDKRARTEKWDKWKGNINIGELKNTVTNYNDYVSDKDLTAHYGQIWKKNTVQETLEIMENKWKS